MSAVGVVVVGFVSVLLAATVDTRAGPEKVEGAEDGAEMVLDVEVVWVMGGG